jgi:hypothetical protein
MAVDAERIHARDAGYADHGRQNDARHEKQDYAAAQQKPRQRDYDRVRVRYSERQSAAHPPEPARPARSVEASVGEWLRSLCHSGYGPDGAGVPTTNWSCASNWPTMLISFPYVAQSPLRRAACAAW